MEQSRPTRLTRRRLIGATGAAAMLLSVGALGVGLQRTKMRTARRELGTLDPTTFSILAAIADRICPGGEGLPTPWELQVPESIDTFLSSNHPAVGVELNQGLLFVENALPAVFFEGRVRPFTHLGANEQDQVLADLAHSRWALRRTIYKALVGLVSATYWGDRRVFDAIGYQPITFGPTP